MITKRDFLVASISSCDYADGTTPLGRKKKLRAYSKGSHCSLECLNVLLDQVITVHTQGLEPTGSYFQSPNVHFLYKGEGKKMESCHSSRVDKSYQESFNLVTSNSVPRKMPVPVLHPPC